MDNMSSNVQLIVNELNAKLRIIGNTIHASDDKEIEDFYDDVATVYGRLLESGLITDFAIGREIDELSECYTGNLTIDYKPIAAPQFINVPLTIKDSNC